MKSTRQFTAIRGVAAAAAIGMTLAACAGSGNQDGAEDEAWEPSQIKWIVPADAGGGFDTSARYLEPVLAKHLDTNLVINNQPGADTAVGTQVAAQEGQDCETILITGVPHILYSYLTQDVSYVYDDDFYPIGTVQKQPAGIMVAQDAKWDSLQELVDDALANPGEIDVAAGQYTSNNYTGMLELQDATGVEFNFVNYGTGGDARTSIVSGEADVMHTPIFSALSVADDTKFLAVHQDENEWSDITDDAPTINDALGTDLKPNQSMYGMFANRACYDDHPERFEQLTDAFEATKSDDEYLDRLDEADALSGLAEMKADEFHDFILDEEADVIGYIDERPELQLSD